MALRFTMNVFLISCDMLCTIVFCIQYSVLCDSVYSLAVCSVRADGTIITVSNLWTTLIISLYNFRSLYILRKSYDVKCNVLRVCTVFRFEQSKTCISLRSVMFCCLSTCVVVRTVRFVTNKWHILYAYNYSFLYCSTNNFLCDACGNVFYCQLFCFCSIWQ